MNGKELYQAGTDSYQGLNERQDKLIGSLQIRLLSKIGLRSNAIEHLIVYYVVAAESAQFGYDYCVLSEKRTNTGRPEAVRTSTKAIKKGNEYLRLGYKAQTRRAFDRPTKLCKGDIMTPEEFQPNTIMPQCYEQLPIHPTMIPKPQTISQKQLTISAVDLNAKLPVNHDDELLALIDCANGHGNRAKAYRAIARFLLKEVADMESECEPAQ